MEPIIYYSKVRGDEVFNIPKNILPLLDKDKTYKLTIEEIK